LSGQDFLDCTEGRTVAFPPEVFLIGAQKAGTTYLASLLDQHPGIRVSQPKEPHYFTQYRDRELSWYRSCFPDAADDQLLVDASPSYSAAPVHDMEALISGATQSRFAGVPEAIMDTSPGARFIYILRNPVDRIHSAYWHAVRQGDENRSLADAIDADMTYLNASDYLGQIRYYLHFVPPERFLFLRFEDLQKAPESVVDQCARFLGLEAMESVEVARGQHSGYRPGLLLRAIVGFRKRVPGMRRLEKGIWDALPQYARSVFRNRLTRPLPPLELTDRETLVERFTPMIEPLEAATGLDLSVWGLQRQETWRARQEEADRI
jgi:hypothetical protein